MCCYYIQHAVISFNYCNSKFFIFFAAQKDSLGPATEQGPVVQDDVTTLFFFFLIKNKTHSLPTQLPMSVTTAHAGQTEQRNGENGQENRKMR